MSRRQHGRRGGRGLLTVLSIKNLRCLDPGDLPRFRFRFRFPILLLAAEDAGDNALQILLWQHLATILSGARSQNGAEVLGDKTTAKSSTGLNLTFLVDFELWPHGQSPH